MIGTPFLWFQGKAKSSTNANILCAFCVVYPSWDFYLWNKIGSSLLSHSLSLFIYVWQKKKRRKDWSTMCMTSLVSVSFLRNRVKKEILNSCVWFIKTINSVEVNQSCTLVQELVEWIFWFPFFFSNYFFCFHQNKRTENKVILFLWVSIKSKLWRDRAWNLKFSVFWKKNFTIGN